MIIDKFLEFEKENALFDENIEGFHYWHYVRKKVYDEIYKEGNRIGQAHTELTYEPYYKRITLKLSQIKNWVTRNPLKGLEQKDLLVLNHPRRVKNGDYYDCLYTDDLVKAIDSSYYVFEQPILEKHIQPTRTDNLKYMDYINFKEAMYKEFYRRILKFRFDKTDQRRLTQLVKQINTYFGVEIRERSIVQYIENAYLANKVSRKSYARILDKVQPKAIIEVVSYGIDRFIINDLASERDIPVIELQHGTMGKYHIAYNISGVKKLNTFPDYLFVFGSFWKDNTRLPIEKKQVRITGWPYFEKQLKKNNVKGENSKKQTVLFVSQGTVGKKLSKVAVEFSDSLSGEYTIIYKLHPGEYDRWKQEYPWLVDSDLIVIDHSNNDMHHYFAEADIQVGVYSTAIFEGIGYGLDTYILKFNGHEYMEELYENNLATLVETSSELVTEIQATQDQNRKVEKDNFWKSDSLNRMISELKIIIENEGNQNESKENIK